MSKLLFGVLVPAVVFIFSLVVTDLLYRHFSRQIDETEKERE